MARKMTKREKKLFASVMSVGSKCVGDLIADCVVITASEEAFKDHKNCSALLIHAAEEFLVVLRQKDDYGSIAHELGHLLMALKFGDDSPYSKEDEEFLCAFIQHVAENILDPTDSQKLLTSKSVCYKLNEKKPKGGD